MRRAVVAFFALTLVFGGGLAVFASARTSPATLPVPWAALAFSRSEIVGGGVYVVGRGRERLLVPGAIDPAWSPDGRRVAYVAPGAASAGDLYVVDADGGHKGRITETVGDERSPDWSPDGMRLVVEQDGFVVVVRADGQGTRRLAAGISPAWSPGGRRIAYSDGNDIYIVRPGGKPTRLYGTAGAQTQPAWSPDAHRLAFISDESGAPDLFVLDLKTGATARLTADDAVDSSPVFSADGRHVVFVSTRTGVETAWRVPVGGGQALPELAIPYATAPAIRRIPAVGELLPDLEQRPPADLSVKTVKTAGGRRRFLLGFDSATDNMGLGPMVLLARRASRAMPFMRVSQLARMERGPRQTIPEVGQLRYVRSPTHNHWHILGFQRYELRRIADNGLVVRDHKSGFCLADHYAHAPGRFAFEPRHPVFEGYCERGNPHALSVFQGTSVGYTDRYPSYFHGQNLNLTGVPRGNYVLVHRSNRRLLLHELRYENNAASVRIRIRWPRGRSRPPSVQVVRTCPDSDRC